MARTGAWARVEEEGYCLKGDRGRKDVGQRPRGNNVTMGCYGYVWWVVGGVWAVSGEGAPCALLCQATKSVKESHRLKTWVSNASGLRYSCTVVSMIRFLHQELPLQMLQGSLHPQVLYKQKTIQPVSEPRPYLRADSRGWKETLSERWDGVTAAMSSAPCSHGMCTAGGG